MDLMRKESVPIEEGIFVVVEVKKKHPIIGEDSVEMAEKTELEYYDHRRA